MDKQKLKTAVLAIIEQNRDRLIEIGETLYRMPETGFKEYQTAAYVKQILENCGLDVTEGIAVTGLKATASGKKQEANIALMGELDALIMPGHPHCHPERGTFHGCGHHAQLTTILGVALGLVKSGLMQELDGSLTFIGVPAEEVIEQEFRKALRDEGKLFFLSGKQEMIRLGVFDDVDAVLCSHVMGQSSEPRCWLGHSWNGVIFKTVELTGKSAHAGLAPDRGINALEAALCGMNNINAMRESFHDDDHVRIHYIITKGGDSCNIVPDDVRMEFGVRAAHVPAMKQADKRVDAALRLGAEAIGAGIKITNSGMDMPCRQDRTLGAIYLQNARDILGDDRVEDAFGSHRGSSTDCGDVASLLPLIHPYFGGFTGLPHANDFDIADPYAAYVVPAKLAAATVIDLLWDNASATKELKKTFKPSFSGKEDYLAYAAALFSAQ